jgi:hypothetical protein
MKIKLKFWEPDYYVNEKKGTVTCVLKFRLDSVDSSQKDVDAYHAVRCMAESVYGENNPISYRYSIAETAKLDPNDTFDVEIGKKVARAKAESSAYKFCSKILTKSIEKFTFNLASAASEFIEKASGVVRHNRRYLDQF